MYKEFKKLKISNICDKKLLILVLVINVEVKIKKIFKERESIKILKVFDLINDM